MFDKIKTLFSPKQYMFVGNLYKINQDTGLNMGEPFVFKEIPKGAVLLLISKDKIDNDNISYVFLYENEKIFHTNSIKYEKYFLELFTPIEENS